MAGIGDRNILDMWKKNHQRGADIEIVLIGKDEIKTGVNMCGRDIIYLGERLILSKERYYDLMENPMRINWIIVGNDNVGSIMQYL